MLTTCGGFLLAGRPTDTLIRWYYPRGIGLERRGGWLGRKQRRRFARACDRGSIAVRNTCQCEHVCGTAFPRSRSHALAAHPFNMSFMAMCVCSPYQTACTRRSIPSYVAVHTQERCPTVERMRAPSDCQASGRVVWGRVVWARRVYIVACRVAHMPVDGQAEHLSNRDECVLFHDTHAREPRLRSLESRTEPTAEAEGDPGPFLVAVCCLVPLPAP